MSAKEPINNEMAKQPLCEATTENYLINRTADDQVKEFTTEDIPYISRGGRSNKEVSDRIKDDNYWQPPKTLRSRLQDALYRFLVRSR